MISCPAWLTLLLWIMILLTQESNAANKTASLDQQDDAFYKELLKESSSVSKAIIDDILDFGETCHTRFVRAKSLRGSEAPVPSVKSAIIQI
eukprot:scaffold2393_cov288-Chaetoceros_neogracile.AAC.9